MPAYLIAYDVCDPKRLRKVAKLLERHATRCQYSVFLFQGDESSLRRLIDSLAALIQPTDDVIQAWQIPQQIPHGLAAIGDVWPCNSACVIADARTIRHVLPVISQERASGESS